VLIKEKERFSFFQFLNLSRFSTIHHGIFTRKRGFSPKPFDGFNISFDVGDNPEFVEKNRKAMSEFFETITNSSSMIYLKQIHSDHVLVLDRELMSKKLNDPDMLLSGDAIITNLPHKNLVIQVADCQAVLLYDPVRHVVANVHSGWRGSIQNVIGKTVRLMKERFMSNPTDIVAGIGPSLGPCCAEFVNFRNEISEEFRKYKVKENYCFDFWSISRDQMISEGVLNENIETSQICTKCRTDLFFSYRCEQVTGRFSVVVGLKQ
jgi:polyphenol oxidase